MALNRVITAIAVLAFAASLIVPLRAHEGDEENDGNSRVQIGYQIAPVMLNVHGKSRGAVGLGSYLVNAVAACNDCHTWPNYAPGGNPYAGQPEKINVDKYLAGGRVFPTPFGNFTSKNITPDSTGRPAGLTHDEFISVMRTGHDPDTGQLLQVMPWSVFSHMSDNDLDAIYQYLRSIPSRPNNY